MATALVSISVDLESPVVKTSTANIEQTAQLLIELLNGENLPVTWVAREPADSPAIGAVMEAASGHEVALRIASELSGLKSGRSRFATDFLDGMRRAAAAGISITTLATPESLEREHLELIARHGISAIRADRIRNANAGHVRFGQGSLVPLRFGLWQIGSDLEWSGGSWLRDVLGARRIGRALDRRIAAGLPTHLTIDAPALSVGSNSRLSGLTKVLRHLERRRSAGAVHVGTIAQTLVRLSARPTVRAAKSILRAA